MAVSGIRLGPPLSSLLDFLGPLKDLPGTWRGAGFNLIWRPFDINQVANGTSGHDHFLELNLTKETLKFDLIDAPIPNRGLLQPDITLFGLTYMQHIQDVNTGGALHIEPGIWITVPATTNPLEQHTVARMASVPHGTTILAQGTASPEVSGPPKFPAANTVPLVSGTGKPNPFPTESTLTNASAFRTPRAQLAGITQGMVDNPNSLLQSALSGHTVEKSLTINVSSAATATTVPNAGGGTDNIAFLTGAAPGNKPNANAAHVTATFWIEKVKGGPFGLQQFLQLQYTQTVILNFHGKSWPHVSVATLRKS